MPDDRLPAVPEPAEADEVLTGEVVAEPPRYRMTAVVLGVVRHEHTKTAARHGSYVAAGAMVAWRRWRDARTTAPHLRGFRAAEAAGDAEAALKWAELAERFREGRHKRRMEWAELPLKYAKLLPWLVIGPPAALLGLGTAMAVATKHAAEVVVPIVVVAHVIEWIVIIISVTWAYVLLAVPCVTLAVLYRMGRHAGAGGWTVAAKDAEEDGGIVITADTVVLALQHLGRLPALKKAFKESWRPVFTLLPVREGRGYAATFSLPLGVTAEMIADQRPVLARNLHRDEIEVWPSAGPPGFASLWVADSGAISKNAPEYPLLREGAADVFEGVPGGVVARGDEALIPVVANNGVFGGQMGQGKSNACRVVMLGCALDPICELDVFVFAGNGDFDAYAPRLAHYRKGVEDDTIAAAVNRLHELYEEVGRREARLAELGAKKVTRSLAQAHPDMRPIVALFSECHELFGHPELGKLAAELAIKTAKRARKTAITLLFDTQSSRKEAIPPALVELVSVNACFYVKTWRSNDGFLGDGSFAACIRATNLRPGRDRGTSVITGISDAQYELLKWYYIEVDDDTGYDAATEVIARAMANVAPGTPVEASLPAAAIEVRDLLADLREILGDSGDRAKVNDLPAQLRKLAPHWGPYRDLTGTQLRQLLDDEGVRTTNTRNVPQLDPADLRRVLAERGE